MQFSNTNAVTVSYVTTETIRSLRTYLNKLMLVMKATDHVTLLFREGLPKFYCLQTILSSTNNEDVNQCHFFQIVSVFFRE